MNAWVLGAAIGGFAGGLIGFYSATRPTPHARARDDILPRKAGQ